MQTVLIVIHLMVVLALVGVVLLQRSEGGGLGIGGGSGFMTARGAANALTRATAILAAAFFVTSLTLSIIARYGEKPIDILDRVPATSDGAGKGVLNQLPGTTTPTPPSGNAAPTPPSGNGAATTPPANAPAAPPAAGSTSPATNGASTAPAAPQVPNQ
ncbi:MULTISPECIES: preprotein translocase subunit SecG [unclassified Mesorhizobium]|uniref:preprotein translocase subunit SecG n=1 Tax=unclassified Mesorhizobium TaxID=325217 RepID=UPI0011296574|nr:MULTISPECIES: preprotein translocase subunit SecG [unclassified Mesorhizobium]MBZ9896560.1 preprotein translocase subunit SecG [Mesorhizobium sp. BR1-1-6]MBZ9919477.1 preprotein translocase subunit SecG [Mesorhizobium sp. BR1-1-7]MBZ9953764.1 preprotein translocase subunit SecG [Mesorhizobium sp. BR1-1-15]MBZ9970432.1 preprotein translocase subunit SecG [Mesorhizobium sp. BR1-1-12]MCA0027421.1 preprotein translocase subunit SecG [Mesorhizobium sp. B263B1A]